MASETMTYGIPTASNGRPATSNFRRYADGLASLYGLERAHQALLPDLVRLASDRRLREHLESRCAPVRRQLRRLDLLIGALPSGGQAPRPPFDLPRAAPIGIEALRRRRDVRRRDEEILELSAWICAEKLKRYRATRIAAGRIGRYEAATHLLCSSEAEASAGERLEGVRLRMVVDDSFAEMDRVAS